MSLDDKAGRRIQSNRLRKARRFLGHFYAQMRDSGVLVPEADRPALEKALALVRSASKEQWAKLAKELKKDPPSGATYELIVSELETAIENAHLHGCRACGKPRDDATDQLCRKCQVDELMEGNREFRAAVVSGDLR